MYIPNYNAVLVPQQQDYQPHTLPAFQGLANILPFQPPRRRRPILAVLDLLQKRYNLADDHVQATNMGIKIGGSDKPVNGSSTSNDSVSKDKGKPDSNDKTGVNDSQLHENSNENKNKTSVKVNDSEKSNKLSESIEVKRISQVNRIYSLLDSLTKDSSEGNEGLTYAFKYQVPSSSKYDEVEDSVQKSLRRFLQISVDPLRNRVLKSPIDYRKAQSRLDTLLEESSKSEVPIHLNTPGAFGPILLNEYLDKVPDDGKEPDPIIAEIPEGQELKPTKLTLRPVAKAVAGPKGIAVASPIAKAVLRRGQAVTLEYDPDAVAIAGPGGRAHAHPEFTVDYID